MRKLLFFAFLLFAIFLNFAWALPDLIFQPPTPSNSTSTHLNWTYINITSSEDLNQSFIEWGNSSGLSNVSMSNSSLINWFINMTGLVDGAYNYAIFAENTTGDWNYSATQFIIVDTAIPQVYVQSPQNSTTYLVKTIDLNTSANEAIAEWKYSINDAANTTFAPNTTITIFPGLNNLKVYANDSAGNVNITTIYFTLNTTLDVNLSEPDTSSPINYVQNTTFSVNATVFCRHGNCGNVAGTITYNQSSVNPDTPISTTFGAEPFFINESSPASTKSCSTSPLDEGEFCNLTWTINATDSTLSSWKIGVNFSSDSGWTAPNTTAFATISIQECFVDITVGWASIEFSDPLFPNSYQNPALGNDGSLYNITINPGSCNTDVYIKGSDIQNTSFGYALGIGNLTWSNASSDYSSSFNMTQSYVPLKKEVPDATNITMWYWINIPPTYAASYNGTVYITGVESGNPSP